MTTAADTALDHLSARELAHRSGDGIDVTLLWHPGDGALTVLVVDSRSGSIFVVPVGEARPLDVFAHPYAYAAARGVGYAPRATPAACAA